MKIATLNLRHDADRWVERHPFIIETLAATNADVICFQEVAFNIDQANLIASGLSGYEVVAVPKWHDNAIEGVGILSRLPILEHEPLNLMGDGHRVSQRIVVEVDGQRLNIANTHLHHRPTDQETIRLPQIQQLLGWMFDYSPDRWLLTGDMNAEPDTSTIKAARERLGVTYFDANNEYPVTFPTPLIEWDEGHVCIDYIFYDAKTIRVEKADLIANKAHPSDPTLYPSDHFGLSAEISLI